MSNTDFTPYNVYYDEIERKEGQVPIMGRSYFTPTLWLPIPYETPEEIEAREARAIEDRAKAKQYRGKTAEDLDRECDEMHRANTAYRQYGRV